jgi:hypothetical protein
MTLRRLAKGVALLGCALACCTEKASAQFYALTTGTISNFAVTATSGTTTGSVSLVGPSTGIFTNLSISAGPGSGHAFAVSFPSYIADLVGFTIDDNGAANSWGGGVGSFTMNFTASVVFHDYIAMIAGSSPPTSTTLWNVTGLGSIADGQSLIPGSYTFNFVTTHVASSDQVAGAAVFLAVPETSVSGLPLWAAGLFLVGRSLRQRRSQLQTASSAVSSD